MVQVLQLADRLMVVGLCGGRRTVRLVLAKLSAVRLHETVAFLSFVIAGRVVLVLETISVSVREEPRGKQTLDVVVKIWRLLVK